MKKHAWTPTGPDYELLVEAVTDYAIFFLDTEGCVSSWNAGARKLKGYSRQDVLGRHFSMFYPEEAQRRRWPQHELRVAGEVGRFEDEGWRVRKDGSLFWANVIITRLIDSTGVLRGFSKITRDLTDRRRQEEQLRLSEERFRLLVEGVNDYAIFMLDPDGHIASWNAGAEKNTGYSAPEVLGRHFSIFYSKQATADGWPQRELEIALAEGRVEDNGWRIRKDGSRYWAGVVLTALFDHTGRHRGFAKVTRDLTESRRASAMEDENRRITTFLAMLGHELRNPLAPIANALQLLEVTPNDSSQQIPLRSLIGRQVHHLSKLVDDLLDVGRITSGKIRLNREPLALAEAVREGVEAFAPEACKKSQALTVTLPDEPLWIQGDRTRITQIVGNLLSNAIKFTDEGGAISVELYKLGSNAVLRVKDNGPGIAEALQTKIFSLFFQAQQEGLPAHNGLGLGLSLVHQLVRLHGGDIRVVSSGIAGEGSQFIVEFPATRHAADLPEEFPAALAPSGKVLVVDDNQDAADTLAALLETRGFNASVAYDGTVALEAIHAQRPDFVLLDLDLPGVSGLAVAQTVVKWPYAPILIAVTGYGQAQDRAASKAAGFHAHMTKPFDLETLLRLLAELQQLASRGITSNT